MSSQPDDLKVFSIISLMAAGFDISAGDFVAPFDLEARITWAISFEFDMAGSALFRRSSHCD
jgi:hypothetical protein